MTITEHRRRPRASAGPWHPVKRRYPPCISPRTGKNKVAHPTETRAAGVAGHLTRFRNTGEVWHAYKCSDCGAWHVGRMPKRNGYRETPRLRHQEEWLLELGDRVETHLWIADNPAPEHRLRYIVGLIKIAIMKAYVRQPARRRTTRLP